MGTVREELPSQILLDRCADLWGLANFTFIRKMENIVYSCDHRTGRVYLRLTSPLRRVHPEIVAELNWVEHLGSCGLKVPKLILNKSGQRIASLIDGQQQFEAVVFRAMKGEHPSKEKTSNPKFLKTLGTLIAEMHRASEQYEDVHTGKHREEWLKERGLRHALIAAQTSSEGDFKRRLEQILDWMGQLPRNRSIYGLIHADLGALNLFLEEDDSIGIIDFDDCCYHWFVFDLAIVLFSMAGRFEHNAECPEERQWLSLLLEGYSSVRSLQPQEIEWIPNLIQFACLRLFFWIEHHQHLGTFHPDAQPKVAKTQQWITARLRNPGK